MKKYKNHHKQKHVTVKTILHNLYGISLNLKFNIPQYHGITIVSRELSILWSSFSKVVFDIGLTESTQTILAESLNYLCLINTL